MKPILVVGSANMDLVYRVHHLPEHGETLLSNDFETHPGGKGANQAVAIGRLGAMCEFCGSIGTDGFGDELVKSLTNARVGTSFMFRPEVASGNAAIFVGEDGRNQIVVAPEANSKLTAEHVRQTLLAVQPDIVLAQLEVPLDAVVAASHAERFILNPAPATQLYDDLLSRCFAITPNETEMKLLTGIEPNDEESCRAAANRLLEKGVLNVIITLGKRGCYWKSFDQERWIEPPQVHAIDTTAAGDAFNGALVTFLNEGVSFGRSLEMAVIVGSLSTTKRGAQSSMPTREELLAVAGEV